jgi:hypothetical protein
MRDRREALKLLAGGTAAAIGTSIITTSAAFADQGTVGCLPTNWPTSLGDALTVDYVVSSSPAFSFVRATLSTASTNNIGCAGGGTPELQVRWAAPALFPTPSPTRVLIEPDLTDATTQWRTLTAANVVRVVNTTDQQLASGRYTLELQFRAVCRQPRLCWRCITVTATFDWRPGSAPGNITITSANGSTNCDNPAP